MRQFPTKTFSLTDTMLKQLVRIKLFEGVFQSEKLDNQNPLLNLKMKMSECYCRVDAGELCSIHSYKSKCLIMSLSFV